MWGKFRSSIHIDGYIIALIAIVILGTVLGLYQLGHDSLWLDEIITAVKVQEPSIKEVIANLDDRSGRPLHFVFVFLITRLGDSEFWLRLPSVVFGVLSLVVTYLIGTQLFSKREALLAAFLLALSPYHLRYTQEARTYSLLMLLSLLTLYCFLKGWRTGNWRWWAGFTVATVLNTYTHYFSAIVLAAELLYAGIDLISQWLLSRKFDDEYRKVMSAQQKSRTIALITSIIIVGLAFLPSIPHLFDFLTKQGGGSELAEGFEASSLFFVHILNRFSLGVFESDQLVLNSILYLIFFITGVLACGFSRQLKQLLLLFIWIGLPFAILYLIPAKHFFSLRYVIFILPMFLLMISRGLIWPGELLYNLIVNKYHLSWQRWYGVVIAGLLAITIVLLSIQPVQAYYAKPKQPWREIAQFLTQQMSSGEIVIIGPQYYEQCLQYYGVDNYYGLKGNLGDFNSYIENHTGVWYLLFQPAISSNTPGKTITESQPIIFQSFSTADKEDTNIYYYHDDQPQVDDITTILQTISDMLPNDQISKNLLAQAYRSQGEYTLARAAYEKAHKLDPQNPRQLVLLGRAYIEEGDSQQGMSLIRQGLKLDPANSWAHQVYAEMLAVNGLVDEAQAEFQTAMQLANDKGPAALGLCQFRVSQGDAFLNEAIQACQQAVELNPSNPGLRILLGNLYNRTDTPEKAIIEYEQAVNLKPEYDQKDWYHETLGDLYRELGDLSAAASYYEKALKLEPQKAERWRRLGDIYLEIEQPESALVAFQQAAQANPQSAVYPGNNCRIYLQLGEGYEAQAVEACQQAVALDPKNAGYHIQLGTASYNNLEFESALAAYAEALRLDSGYNDKDWYFARLGEVYRELGRQDLAKQAFQRARELRTKSP